MTMRDDTARAGADPDSPPGTVMPRIRGRLRTRLPGPIRVARGQLIVLAGYLLLTPIVLAIITVTGGLAKLNLSTTELAASTIGNIVVAGGCILASRMLLARSPVGYLLGIAVGGFAAAAGLWAIYRIVNGSSGLTDNPAFFQFVYQSVFVVLGAAIVFNLVRVVGEARQLVTDTNVTTGRGLRVPLRDIRIRPGKAVAPPPAIESTDGTGEAAPISDMTAAPTGAAEEHIAVRDTGEPLLAVRGLKKHFPIYGGLLRRQIGTVYAVDGVDFDVFPGEIFSLVGESGCGKTTLGRTRPPADAADGRPGRLRRLRAGRRRSRRHAPAPAPDADHLPGPVRVAQPADARQRHHRRGPPRPGRHGSRRRATSGSRTRSRSSACGATTPGATRTSSAAASASASASPAPSPSSRTSSSATSPSRPSTSRSRARS